MSLKSLRFLVAGCAAVMAVVAALWISRRMRALVVAGTMMSGVVQADEATKAVPKMVQADEAAKGVPKIQFDRTVYDFGTTSMVESVTGKFVVENAGTAPLQLQKPAPSCGCTVAEIKPDNLKPGEKAELKFTWNIGNIRGHAEKAITVPSNDPGTPNVLLTIKVDMKTLYSINPERIWLGDIRRGMTTNLTVTIQRTDGTNFTLSRVEGNSDLFTTQIESDAGESGTQARVKLQLNSDRPARRFNDMIRVYTTESQGPIGTIFVNGRLLGDLVLTPEQLWWSVPDVEGTSTPMSPEALTRRITVNSTLEGQTLEVRNPTSSLKELNVSFRPVEAGKSFELVAKLDGRPAQSLQGTISFETNIPSQPKVEIPVRVSIIKIQKNPA